MAHVFETRPWADLERVEAPQSGTGLHHGTAAPSPIAKQATVKAFLVNNIDIAGARRTQKRA